MKVTFVQKLYKIKGIKGIEGRMERWNNGRLGRKEECLPCEMQRRSYFYRRKMEK
ncbi:MAG: hypothetical protein KAT38_09415 [Bacteroidales bacterium]|nr:hypothetical protein [Bacteroidales bacterium]